MIYYYIVFFKPYLMQLLDKLEFVNQVGTGPIPNAPARNNAITISKKIPTHNPPTTKNTLDNCFLDFRNTKPAISNAIPNTILITGKYAISKNNHSIQSHILCQIGIGQPLHTAQCAINKETYYPKHDCTKHAVKHNSISFALDYMSHNSINLL